MVDGVRGRGGDEPLLRGRRWCWQVRLTYMASTTLDAQPQVADSCCTLVSRQRRLAIGSFPLAVPLFVYTRFGLRSPISSLLSSLCRVHGASIEVPRPRTLRCCEDLPNPNETSSGRHLL